MPPLHQKAKGKTRYESQLHLSSWTEQHLRTGRLVKDAYSSSYSEWNADKNWSSQEWKSDELMEVRTGKSDNEQPPGLFAQHTALVNDEEVISLSHAKVYVFSDSVLCLGRKNENPQSNTVWEDKLTWFKDSPQYRSLDTIDGEPMEFEWNIFPGFTTLQLCNKVQQFLSKMSVEPEEFTGRIIFMSILTRGSDFLMA